MNATEIQRWASKYNDRYNPELAEIERDLRSKLPKQGCITQDQLQRVVRWKLYNRVRSLPVSLDRIEATPEEYIRLLSKAAFHIENPKLQLKTLTAIPGIGVATATAILTFHQPAAYGVGGSDMVAALLGEDRSMRVTDYPELLTKLHKINPGQFDLRTVEKAIYHRYRTKKETV